MNNWLEQLLDPRGFSTPVKCGGWTPLLVFLTKLADYSIFSAYIFLGVLLGWLFVICPKGGTLSVPRQRPLFALFGAFIFLCGVTHLLRALAFQWPAYRFLVLVSLVTSAVSWLTAWVFLPGVMGLHYQWVRNLDEDPVERFRDTRQRLMEREQELGKVIERLEKKGEMDGSHGPGQQDHDP